MKFIFPKYRPSFSGLYFPFLFMFIILTAACNNDDKSRDKKTKEVGSYTAEQFHKNFDFYFADFSSDEEEILMTSNETGIYNVFVLNPSTGKKEQLTFSATDSHIAEDFVPGTRHFLYSADKGGNENSHIYLKKTDGTVIEITPGDNVKARFWHWNETGDHFYFISNKRDTRYFDLYKCDTIKWEPRMIYKNEKGFDLMSLSRNEQFVTLVESITGSWINLIVADLKTGKTQYVNDKTIEAINNPTGFSSDSKFLYFTTDEGSEFSYVKRYELATGTQEKIFADNWDVTGMNLSYNNAYRVYYVNEDGAFKVRFFKDGDKEIKFPSIDGGSVASARFSRSEKKMVLTVASSYSPANLFLYDIATGDLKQLTNSLNPEMDVKDMVKAQVIRFKSYDGLEIPAIYYKPHPASEKNKVPAVLSVHGGPGGQAMQYYYPGVQYLVNKGYAILDVNNRGSSGYGKTFYKMDDQAHGDKDLRDLIWAKKYLTTQAEIDSNKIGIMGGSYGGYLTLAALCFYPEEFKVGIDIFGVSNWLRTLKEIPPHWAPFRDALYKEIGNPNTADSVRLKEFSPLLNAHKINKPLMVLQGANDPRVLQVESDEIVSAVKANNVPVEYILFPDEGHGFVKKENEIKADKSIGTFLDTYLKGSNKNP